MKTYIATVHFRRSDWIDRQLASIHAYAPEAEVWASLDHIEPEHFAKFTRAWSLDLEPLGPGIEPYASSSDDPGGDGHGLKLNELARRICEVAQDDDTLLFLDGDALLLQPLANVLAQTEALAAVRRNENDGDEFPHPSYCLTTVGRWKQLQGDWRRGVFVTSATGREMTDTGTKLTSQLAAMQWSWLPLIRINATNLHPVWFGIYGTPTLGPVVYHHGAGFRTRVSRADLALKKKKKWFQRHSFEDSQAALDQEVLRWIDSDSQNWWRATLMKQ